MQAKEWTRTFGRCTRSRRNKASMSALEKNQAKRRREVSVGENGLRKPCPRPARLTVSAHVQLRPHGGVFAMLV
jgi:hypothetical protein